MPTWGEQIRELRDLKQAADKSPRPGGPSPHDLFRRKYFKALSEHTGRAAIFYGTCWLENRPVPNVDALSLNLGHKQGFMEAVSNISERDLDLILTSPGGSPEAAFANAIAGERSHTVALWSPAVGWPQRVHATGACWTQHQIREKVVPQVTSTHPDGSRRCRREGLQGAAAGRWRDRHDLDPAVSNRTDRWEQIGVAGHEQLDLGSFSFGSHGVHDHLDGEIHVGLLLGLKSDFGVAVSAHTHLFFI